MLENGFAAEASRERSPWAAMSGKIFISYRREDSAGYAGRVYDRLAQEFSHDILFMDVDTIALGDDFPKRLSDALAQCTVLLAVIGPNWLAACDAKGRRRLDDARDFVRMEIAAALAKNIDVIPIFVEGVQSPHVDDLPEDLTPLASRQGLSLRHISFRADMEKLIQWLRAKLMPPVPESGYTRSAWSDFWSDFWEKLQRGRDLFP